MKVTTLFLVVLCFVMNSHADQNMAVLNDEEAKLNYSVGYKILSYFQQQKIEIDPDVFLAGVQDALSGKLQLSEDEIRSVMTDLGREIINQKNSKSQKLKNYRERNQAFLQDNRTREGVITTNSGLQYLILKPGQGASPVATDNVELLYKGSLINGREFENGFRKNEPVTVTVNSVIAGWSEALQLMKTGSKWQLFIPADLALGKEGDGRKVPPNSTLIVEVELLAIL